MERPRRNAILTIVALVVVVAIALALLIWADSSRTMEPDSEQGIPPASSENAQDPDPVKDSTGPTGDISPSPSGTGPGPEGDVLSQ